VIINAECSRNHLPTGEAHSAPQNLWTPSMGKVHRGKGEKWSEEMGRRGGKRDKAITALLFVTPSPDFVEYLL